MVISLQIWSRQLGRFGSLKASMQCAMQQYERSLFISMHHSCYNLLLPDESPTPACQLGMNVPILVLCLYSVVVCCSMRFELERWLQSTDFMRMRIALSSYDPRCAPCGGWCLKALAAACVTVRFACRFSQLQCISFKSRNDAPADAPPSRRSLIL